MQGLRAKVQAALPCPEMVFCCEKARSPAIPLRCLAMLPPSVVEYALRRGARRTRPSAARATAPTGMELCEERFAGRREPHLRATLRARRKPMSTRSSYVELIAAPAARYALPVAVDARTLAAGWLALAVGALLASGVFSVLLVLARAPYVKDVFPLADFFRVALVVHVDLSVLVWFSAFAGLLWSLHGAPRLLWLGWAGSPGRARPRSPCAPRPSRTAASRS